MKSLNDLNSKSNAKNYAKKALKINDLEYNEEYSIQRAARVKTMYGEKIMLELSNNVIFLPPKFNEIENSTLADINGGGFYICKLKEPTSERGYILNFTKKKLNIYTNKK